jgi:hypothetical protein
MSSAYFGKFFTKKQFDFSGLINKDFFDPVRILFQNQYYISSAKLLLVAIDSMGFIEYGDSKKNPFISWLDEYSNLKEIGITSNELWEHRNSLLHMSNLDSRKIRSGHTRRLVAYVGYLPEDVVLSDARTGYYDFQKLIFIIAKSIENWGLTYNIDRNKIHSFVERYDLVASDARMTSFYMK